MPHSAQPRSLFQEESPHRAPTRSPFQGELPKAEGVPRKLAPPRTR